MGSVSREIGNMGQCRSVEDRGDIEARQSGFFLQFAQPTFAARLVRFDVPTWRTPAEQTVTDEEHVSTPRLENPGRCAHVTSGDLFAGVVITAEAGEKLRRDIIFRRAVLHLFVEVGPSAGNIGCRMRVGHQCFGDVVRSRATRQLRRSAHQVLQFAD